MTLHGQSEFEVKWIWSFCSYGVLLGLSWKYVVYRAHLRACRALLRVSMALLGVYRALWRWQRDLLKAYRALFIICRALLRVYRALERVYRALERIERLFLEYMGLFWEYIGLFWEYIGVCKDFSIVFRTHVPCLLFMCAMTHSHVCRDSFSRGTWLLHTCDNNSFIYTREGCLCLHVWHDAFIRVTWLIRIRNITLS